MSRVRTAIVAHDAGGAEILSSWVRRQGSEDEVSFALAGPARKVFERKLGAVDVLPLDQALAGAARVLTGTGWQSTLELDAIALARTRCQPSVSFLDHWVNYRERFSRGAAIVLPDELWVGDAPALALAREALPEVPARRVDNPYFADIRDQAARAPQRVARPDGALALLYVCEPIADHAAKQWGNPRHWGYTEHDALRYCLRQLDRLRRPIERIVVRRHPSEAADKYLEVAGEFDLPLWFGGIDSLIAEVAACDVVVGCNSMAMVIGLLAGKRVLSTIPPGGGPCKLPQPEIELLREL